MFSILIPSYNNLNYLKLCLKSIFKNSVNNHEIIIHVNEGSDGTLQYIRDNKIKYTFSNKNIGLCTAINSSAKISSTKSLAGHSQGATGAHEAIYSLIMLDNDFVAASANIEALDPEVGDANVVTSRIDAAGLNCVLSNSFGFGGTNASLAFKRFET